MMRTMFRGYMNGILQFEEYAEFEDDETGNKLAEAMGEAHARLIADQPHMIEIEFLDEPMQERFFRFGTDPKGMRMPIGITIQPSKLD